MYDRVRTSMRAWVFPGLSTCFLLIATSCSKEVPTGPCETVPPNYLVSLVETPNAEQAKFFSRNYKACKTRNLKKDPNALFSVGVSVLHGLGTQKDPMKAFLWFKGAADKGNTSAQLILSQMFMSGTGVPRDPWIAKKYQNVVQANLNPGSGSQL